MGIAQIGPFTAVLEAAATAVGAGVVIGSAATGFGRLVLGGSRRGIEAAAATGGFMGGGLGAIAAAADITLRYAGLK